MNPVREHTMQPRPPRAARWLLRLLVWGPASEVIAGDLEEEFHRETLPRLGKARARLWFWRQTLYSALACLPLDSISPTATRQGDGIMRTLLQDLRYGLRTFRKNPGFTAAAVLTLGLGIGANTAIFSVINTFLLKPLPFAESSQVTFVLGWNTARDQMRFNVRFADFVDLKTQSAARKGTGGAIEEMAAYRNWSANLTGDGVPRRIQAYQTSANIFDLLGVEPFLGRAFAAEDAVGDGRVAVLSHGLWKRRFGGDRGVIGQDVTLDGEGYTVIGVMPRIFEFPLFNFKGDLWVPLTDDPAQAAADRRGSGWVVAVARLRPEATVAAAQDELAAVMTRLTAEHPETNTDLGVRVIPMQEMVTKFSRPALLAVFGAVFLVLLMACANVANLLLARAMRRSKEVAVRTALGAGTARLVRQLLTESLLLAMLGGALGVGLAYWILHLLHLAMPDVVLRVMPNVEAMGLDRATLGFALALSLVTGMLFGLVPALQTARTDVRSHLHEGAQGTSAHRQRLRQGLVVGEVALSLLLLVVSGLLTRSVQNLLAVDPGFEAEGVLTASVSLPGYRYAGPQERLAFYETTAERVATLPGVESAGLVNILPFSTAGSGTSYVVAGRPEPEPGTEPRAGFRVASPGYLDALDIPVLRGRGLEHRDRADAPPVALVNRLLAEQAFPGESAIGRQLRLGTDPENPLFEIVGVVGNVKHWTLSGEDEPEIYVALAQWTPARMSLAVRTSGPPEELTALVRSEILKVDPQQPIFHVKTLTSMVAQSRFPQTGALFMTTIFAALALVLAALGLYGVIAYTVSQGTREIGIRMALGARAFNVTGRVLREALVLVALGTALGLAGAWGLTRFLSSLLYGISPAEPAAFLTAVPLLGLVALLAAAVPALRAARVDPIVTLRAD